MVVRRQGSRFGVAEVRAARPSRLPTSEGLGKFSDEGTQGCRRPSGFFMSVTLISHEPVAPPVLDTSRHFSHFDIDGVEVGAVLPMAAGGMGRRAFTASCSSALLSFARASGMAGASGRAAGSSRGVP